MNDEFDDEDVIGDNGRDYLPGDKLCRCGGTGVVIGEPRGHDADGNHLFVQWVCDCQQIRGWYASCYPDGLSGLSLDQIIASRRVLNKNAKLYRRLAASESKDNPAGEVEQTGEQTEVTPCKNPQIP